jgi:chromosome segregation ATPase
MNVKEEIERALERVKQINKVLSQIHEGQRELDQRIEEVRADIDRLRGGRGV